MTNKERLISLLGFAPADINTIDGALIDGGLIGTDAYDTTTHYKLIRILAIGVCELLLSTGDYTNADQTSLKYDRNAVLARIKLLKGELGLSDQSLPTISSPKWW
jgi:hypothetical protein